MAKRCSSPGCGQNALTMLGRNQPPTGGSGCPHIYLSELSANSVTENLPFDSIINITGGADPHSLGIVAGAFPPGMGLIYTHGAWYFNGTCAVPGVYSFTIGGLDNNGCAIEEHVYNFTVEEAVTPVCVPTFILDADHLDQQVGIKNPTNFGGFNSESLSTGNVNGASLLSIVSGTIPPGMGFFHNGSWWQMGATPTLAGSYTFTIGGTDGAGCPVTEREFTIVVSP